MPWDGSGNYSRTDGVRTGATVWEQARAADVNPNAKAFDTAAQDMADALELAVLRDGQNTPIKNLPMGGRKHTGVSDASANSEYATYGQLLALAVPFIGAAQVQGGANAPTLTATPSPAAYAVGRGYRFVAKRTNTGAMTLKEGAKAAVAMLRSDGEAFEGGEVESGTLIVAIYNGSKFVTNVGVRRKYMTLAAYNALATKRNGVLYFIRE